ncbi:AMP-dependent synthetase/ligase [Candidatus Latescibacterota bacterium]
MKTIDEAFRESVRTYPDRTALRYYQDESWEHITYSELNNAVNITAAGLAEIGTGRESKVSIMSENRPEWFVCYLAINTAGAVAVPIDAHIGEVETGHILNHSGAETLICSMRCYEIISRILSELKVLKNIIIFDRNITVKHEHKGAGVGQDVVDNGRKNDRHKLFLSYDEFRDKGITCKAEGDVTFPEKDITGLTSIIYTSGTTGAAKGVMLTHKNIMSNVATIDPVISLSHEDNFVLLLPLHHSFPFTICLVLPLVKGSSISFVDILSRDRTRLIMECRPTLMVGVPLLYSKIYRGIMRQIESSLFKTLLLKYGGRKIIGRALKKKLGGRIRLMVSGAAPMEPSVIEGFVGLGIEFLEGYGLTETSPIVSVNPIGAIKIGSVGKAMTGVEVRIDNPDPEDIGEIVVKGDNVMQGYYKNPEQTAKVLRDGWFYTGDLGRIDEDGYIFITGRAKDVIVTRGGKNVYPEIIETEIGKSRFIAETVVIGYKTKGLVGEDVGVLVYPDYETLIEHAKKEGITFKEHMDINELTEDAKDELVETFRPLLESEVKNSMTKLADYQRVTRIVIERDEFTKTSTRKIKRFLYKGRLDILEIE